MLRREMRAPTAVRTGADRTLEPLEAQIGRSLDEVETPVVVLDLERLEANLQRLQSYADTHAIALWPHTKTHKAPEIGLRQLAIGAGGLTVAKTGEAEVFHEAGAPRILVHYPPFGADKRDRLARFASEGLELTVAVDSLASAEGLAAALRRRNARADLFVELDVGLHRTGQVTSGGALELAQQLSKLPAVEVTGISCYPGHAREDPDTIGPVVEAVDSLLRETRDAFTAAGIRCDRISGGSTPTRYVTHTTCVNELRAGTYALLDRVDAPVEPELAWRRVPCPLQSRSSLTVSPDRSSSMPVRRPSPRTFIQTAVTALSWAGPTPACIPSTRSMATWMCLERTTAPRSATACR